jgi:hypothetical protein
VAGPGSLPGPANRESGANPERPRRGDRAQTSVTPLLAIAGAGAKKARLVRRPDTQARKSEDLPASTAAVALRGTGDVESYPILSLDPEIASAANYRQRPADFRGPSRLRNRRSGCGPKSACRNCFRNGAEEDRSCRPNESRAGHWRSCP